MDVHGRGLNNVINYLRERLLRLVYKDRNSSFKDLVNRDNSFIVHHRNIQSIAIELFKVLKRIFRTQ